MLTAGFKTLTQNSLTIGLNVTGKIEYTFDNRSALTSSQTSGKEIYIVGNVVFCAVIFGREHSSNHHCCQRRLSPKEFTNLVKHEEPLTYNILNTLVETVRNGKPLEDCKVKA